MPDRSHCPGRHGSEPAAKRDDEEGVSGDLRSPEGSPKPFGADDRLLRPKSKDVPQARGGDVDRGVDLW